MLYYSVMQQDFPAPCFVPMDEKEFINTVNDFWYHTVWCTKKIARGELWTALTCVDGYLKQCLLRIIELSAHAGSGGRCDVWHNGRLMERWAAADTVEALKKCFGRYDRSEVLLALLGTSDLYGRLARRCADTLGYAYPARAEEYARSQCSALMEK